MRRHNSVLKDFMYSNNIHKRYIAFLTALSLMITLAVPFAVPKEVSAAQDDSTPWIDEAYTKPPKGAYNFEDDITGVTVKESDVDYNVRHNDDGSITIETNGDQIGAEFTLSYTINNDVVSLDQPFIYYWLPDAIEILKEFSGPDWAIADPSYTAGPAGYFSISEDGLLVIQFTEDYINAKLSSSGESVGTITFGGDIFRDNTADGDKDANIGGTDIDFVFPNNDFSVTKSGKVSGSVEGSDDEKVVIDWKVTVTNLVPDDENNSLEGLILRDPRFKNAIGGTNGITVTPKRYGDFVTDPETGEVYYKFKDDLGGTEPSKVTFTFSEEVDYENGKKEENTATLEKNGEEVDNGKASVTFDKTTITKKGDIEYSAGDADMVNWTVKVKRPYGLSLEDCYVEDEAFKHLDSDDITLKSGDKTLTEGTDYTFDKTNGKITFLKDYSDVTITYKTKAVDQNDGVNRTPNNGTTKITNNSKFVSPKNEEETTTGSVDYRKKYHIDSKTGTYDRVNDNIVWNVKASADAGYNLDNYELQDDAFAKADALTEIIITTTTGERISLTAEKLTGNTFVFNDNICVEKKDDKLIIHGTDAQSIEIIYETKVTEAEREAQKAVNTVRDNNDNSVTSGDVGIKDREPSTNKKYVSSDNTEGGTEGEDGIWYIDPEKGEILSKTMHWKVDMISDSGFSGYPLVEKLGTAPAHTTHYINEPIIVTAYKDNTDKYNKSGTVLKEDKNDGTGGDYTITWVTDSAGNKIGYTINFKESVDAANYHYIKVEYTSTFKIRTEELTDSDFKDGQIRFAFRNSANDKSASHTFVVQDKNHVEETTLKIIKVWNDGSDKVHERPSKITYRLQRRLGTSGDWVTIYWDDKAQEWKEGDKTYTLTGNEGEDTWTKLLQHLPKDTKAHTANYYYRVVEESVDGYTTVYSDENGVEGNGEFTITNNKKRDIQKSTIGKDGTPLYEGSSISMNDLATRQKGNTTYYIIRYRIDITSYEESQSNGYSILKDKIPKGFSLVYDPNGNSTVTTNHPQFYLDNNGAYDQYGCYRQKTLSSLQNGDFYYDNGDGYSEDTSAEKNVIYFGFSSARRFEYEIETDEKTLLDMLAKNDGKFQLSNTVEDTLPDGEKKSSTTEVTITGESNIEKGLVTKTADNDKNGDPVNGAWLGVIKYTVYVNPEGKTLSNSGEYDVIDDLIFNDIIGEGLDLNLLEAELVDIKVEEVLSADPETTTPLPSDKYSYSTETRPESLKPITVTYNFSDDWKTTDAVAGDVVTFNITGTPDYTFPDWSCIYYNSDSKLLIDLSGESIGKDGTLKVTATIPENINGYVSIWSNIYNNVQSITATTEKTALVKEADERLTVTVPDEKPLKITYSYKITYDGKAVPNRSIVNITNSASTDTGNVTGSDTVAGAAFDMNYGSGTIESTDYRFLKYNVGNVGETLPGAKFYIARWDGAKWVYATGKKAITDNEKTTGYEILFGDGAYTTTTNDTPASGPAIIEFSAADYKNGSNRIQMASGYLYKFIEIVAPSGYEPADKVAVRYYELGKFGKFSDKSEDSTYVEKIPDYATPVETIQLGSTIGIPNNKLIDIKAKKVWKGTISDVESAEFTLYWSYKKLSTGIPDDAVEVGSADDPLGITGIKNPKTVKSTDETAWTAVWEDLPNGFGDEPIYYYVKETAYTVNGTRYTLQEDGSYKSGDSLGPFQPSYTGNGANKDTTITVANSVGLVVYKVWRNSDNTEMTAAPPLDAVQFRLYGKKNGQETLIDTYTLSSSTNPAWQITIPPEDIAGKGYTSFRVEEVTDDSKVSEKLYGYTISYTYNTNGATGEIKIINKNSKPTKVDIPVEKKWVDGDASKRPKSIKLYLYRTTSYQEDNGLELGKNKDNAYKTVTVMPDANGNWSYTWEGEPYADGDGTRYYYYVIEDKVDGYSAKYKKTDRSDSQSVTITNISDDLLVDKVWLDSKGNRKNVTDKEIEIEIYRDIDQEPMTSRSFSVGPLNIIGQMMSNSPFGISTMSAASKEKLRVFALGDSITRGFGVSAAESYPKQLESKLQKSVYTNAVVNPVAADGRKIEWLEDDISHAYPPLKDHDITTLIAGTNNLLNSNEPIEDADGDNTNDIKSRMKTLIEYILNNSGDDCVLFVGSVPKISALNNNSGDSRDGYYLGSSLFNNEQDLLDKWDELVTEYNTMLENLVAEYQAKYKDDNGTPRIYYVDIYSAVGDEIDSDGIHPTNKGYENIADAFKSAIDAYFGVENNTPGGGNGDDNDNPGGGTTGSVTAKGYPADFFKADGKIDKDKYTTCSVNGQSSIKIKSTDANVTVDEDGIWHFYFSLPKYDTDGNEMRYYVVEKSIDGYTTSYERDETTGKITITNQEEPDSGIDIEKVWKDADGNQTGNAEPTSGDSITVKLTRTRTAKATPAPTDAPEATATPEPTVTSAPQATATPTATAKPTDTPTAEPTLTVTATRNTISAGETVQLTVNKDSVSYSSSNTNVATVDASGVVTGISAGTVTITVTRGGETATIQITVEATGPENPNPPAGKGYVDASEVMGDSLIFSDDNFLYIPIPDCIKGKTLTDIGIVFENNGVYAFGISHDGLGWGGSIGSPEIYNLADSKAVPEGDKYIVKLSDYYLNLTAIEKSIGVMCYNRNSHVHVIDVRFYYDDTSTQSLSSTNAWRLPNIPVPYGASDINGETATIDAAGSPDVEELTITISRDEGDKDGKWTTISDEDRQKLEEFCLLDDDQYEYTYTIIEDPTVEGYEASYIIDGQPMGEGGFKLNSNSKVKVQVVNTKTTSEPPEANLPSTGGIGFPFVVAGAAMAGMALATYTQKKRKRYSNDA